MNYINKKETCDAICVASGNRMITLGTVIIAVLICVSLILVKADLLVNVLICLIAVLALLVFQ